MDYVETMGIVNKWLSVESESEIRKNSYGKLSSKQKETI